MIKLPIIPYIILVVLALSASGALIKRHNATAPVEILRIERNNERTFDVFMKHEQIHAGLYEDQLDSFIVTLIKY